MQSLSSPAGGEEVPLDYFLAKAVLAKLTETAEKSFLGSFKGAAGSWDKVVKAYEYNREWVGEEANGWVGQWEQGDNVVKGV